jgi:hypothetical protein
MLGGCWRLFSRCRLELCCVADCCLGFVKNFVNKFCVPTLRCSVVFWYLATRVSQCRLDLIEVFNRILSAISNSTRSLAAKSYCIE